MMKSAIEVAVQLINSYIRRFGSLENESLQRFTDHFRKHLVQHYDGHWYPEKPIKGQAYRALDFTKENKFSEPNAHLVCRELHLDWNSFGFQHEMTIWVDPFEVTMRLGNAVSSKSNEQFLVAKFNENGEKIYENDFDTILSMTRVPLAKVNRRSPVPENALNLPVSSSSFRNDPLFTPPRALSPAAPEFHLSNTPTVHSHPHPLETSIDSIDDSFFNDENRSQPERSDTPHSVHSVTSNESSDSGYCGYVESYPYYYKLNRLQKALAFQRHSNTPQNHGRRGQRTHTARQHLARPQSPPTPTPSNIDQWVRFTQKSVGFPVVDMANSHSHRGY